MIQTLHPELLIGFSITFILLLSFLGKTTNSSAKLYEIAYWVTLLTGFGVLLLTIFSLETDSFDSLKISPKDFYKMLLSCIFICSTVISRVASKIEKNTNFEALVIQLITFLASIILMRSEDMMFIYIALECLSFGCYTLAGFKKDSPLAASSILTYYVSGNFLTGFFLYLASSMFGVTGSMNLAEGGLLFAHLEGTSAMFYVQTARFFISLSVVGFSVLTLFKVGVAPFHIWVKNVYTNTALSSTVFLTVFTKMVYFIFISVWVHSVISVNGTFAQVIGAFTLLGVLAVHTGAFLTYNEICLKSLIVQSSIAQVGYLLLTIFVESEHEELFLTYIINYSLLTVLVWALIIWMKHSYTKQSRYYHFKNSLMPASAKFESQKDALEILNINYLVSFSKSNPAVAFLIFFIFLSYAGLPPLILFESKIRTLMAISNFGSDLTVFIILLNSAVSLYYYVNVVYGVYFNLQDTRVKRLSLAYDADGLSLLYVILFVFVLLVYGNYVGINELIGYLD